MSKQMTLGTSFEKYSKTTRREKFLTEMGRIVPWGDLCALIAPVYPKAGDGRPAGRGHHVLQPPRMLVRLQQQLRRSEERLRGEELGGAAGEADLHPRIAERLQDQEDVRGAGAGEAGHRIELQLEPAWEGQ
jgi:hypothetical protein